VGGVYAQTTQISITKTVFLECDGTASQANVTNHQTVTLNWTGGATQQILVNGAAATGWKIKGCALDNHGTATWGLDIDSAAGEALLEEFAIVQPNTTYTGGGIRVGNTGGVVDLHFKDVNVRSAGPVGISLVNVNAHFVGEKVRSSFNTSNEWLLGTATTEVLSFSCYGCIIESNSGVNGYEIVRVRGGRWLGGYCEGGGNANNYCWDIPNTAARATGLEIAGNFVSCVRATCSNAAVHSNFASTSISVRDNFLTGFSAGNAFFQNDAVGGAEISGNDTDAGSIVEASSFTNVRTHGNRLAGTLQGDRILSLAGIEGTASGVAGSDVMWPDVVIHRWRANNNNGGAVTFAYFSDNLGNFASGGNINPAQLQVNGGSTIGLKQRIQNATTGSIGATTRAEILISWPSTMTDTNYTVSCSVQDSTTAAGTQGLTFERIRTKSATQVGLVINNPTAGGITGSIDCIGEHQ
jgi:hypothetical protein